MKKRRRAAPETDGLPSGACFIPSIRLFGVVRGHGSGATGEQESTTLVRTREEAPLTRFASVRGALRWVGCS